MRLEAIAATKLKKTTKQSAILGPTDVISVPVGKVLHIAEKNIVADTGGHFKVTFEPQLTIKLGGVSRKWNQGYIFGPHWKGITLALEAKKTIATPYSASGSRLILQESPLFNQNDNRDWGDDGSNANLRYGGVQCGLSSCAMVLGTIWPNAKVKTLAKEAGGQFEDWVAGVFKKIGAKSTSMEGHAAVFRELGISATARRDLTIAELKEGLEKLPAVIGTAYKESGHFVAAVGYADPGNPETIGGKWPVGTIENLVTSGRHITDSGIIVNDPYGMRRLSGSCNNWIDIANSKYDKFGLHNFYSDAILDMLWVDGGQASGWAVILDPSTPNAGSQLDPPILISGTQAQVITAPRIEPINPVAEFEQDVSELKEILIESETFLKTKPINSTELAATEKRYLKKGEKLACTVVRSFAGHAEIALPDGNKWWIFNKHFSGQSLSASNTAPARPSQAVEIDPGKLKSACLALANPNIPTTEIEEFVSAFIDNAAKFTIVTKRQACHFLAQCFHESGCLLYLEELGDPSYLAQYDKRADLGNTLPEARKLIKELCVDFAPWWGRGLIQTTGFTNYKKYGMHAGFDACRNYQELSRYPHALMSALYFWSSRNPTLSKDVDDGASVEDITKVVNGGTNGLAHRLELYAEFCKFLA